MFATILLYVIYFGLLFFLIFGVPYIGLRKLQGKNRSNGTTAKGSARIGSTQTKSAWPNYSPNCWKEAMVEHMGLSSFGRDRRAFY